MRIDEYRRMAELEDTYWWHVGRRSIFWIQLRRLGLPSDATILNIGCGTGAMIPFFNCWGDVENVDVSQQAVDYVVQRGLGRARRVDGIRLPYPDDHFDAVLATDVLEHIDDDAAALTEWRRVLKPGGTLLMTVPAYQWLWSDHDESLHHYRRYTARGVQRRLDAAGFVVRRRSYMIVFTFPLVVGFRLLRGLVPARRASTKSSYIMLPRPVNRFFTDLLRIEARLVNIITFPFGTSVLAIAEKPTERTYDIVGHHHRRRWGRRTAGAPDLEAAASARPDRQMPGSGSVGSGPV